MPRKALKGGAPKGDPPWVLGSGLRGAVLQVLGVWVFGFCGLRKSGLNN